MGGSRSVDLRNVSSQRRQGRRLILVGVGLITLSVIALIVFFVTFFGAPASESPTGPPPSWGGGSSEVVAVITQITALVGAVTGLITTATGLVKVLRARGASKGAHAP
jgi:hypothetical protein